MMRILGFSAPTVVTCVFALTFITASSGLAQVQPAASPARGKLLFLRCASCHAIAPNAPAKIGPNLGGVIGRKGGSLAGYSYSPAMKAKGPIWTEANLDLWLTAPAKVVPGTSMAFAGLSNPADRQAVIAYLKSPN